MNHCSFPSFPSHRPDQLKPSAVPSTTPTETQRSLLSFRQGPQLGNARHKDICFSFFLFFIVHGHSPVVLKVLWPTTLSGLLPAPWAHIILSHTDKTYASSPLHRLCLVTATRILNKYLWVTHSVASSELLEPTLCILSSISLDSANRGSKIFGGQTHICTEYVD